MSATSLQYLFSAQTDQGRVRGNNEDAVIVDPSLGLAILADGMGGYNAGEVASNMAVSLVHEAMARWFARQGASSPSSAAIGQALHACVGDANRAVLQASIEQPQCAGMGTTLVVAVFIDNRLILGHMGDSRCYRLRAGRIEQITRDHSWVQEQIDLGLMTPEEIASLGCGNLVTRALGVEEDAELEVHEFEVQAQDMYLLCSDGLSDMVEEPELLVLSSAPVPLEEKVSLLVAAANHLGGRDNISVALIQAQVREGNKRGLIARLLHPKTP